MSMDRHQQWHATETTHAPMTLQTLIIQSWIGGNTETSGTAALNISVISTHTDGWT
jgi:hypothetical protein